MTIELAPPNVSAVASPQRPDLRDLEQRLVQAMGKVAEGLGRSPDSMRSLVSIPRAEALLRAMERSAGALAGKRILEIGSGCGLTLALANAELGADAFGVEPGDRDYCEAPSIAEQVLVRFGVTPSRIIRGIGEALPLRSDQFDLVYSFYVLEHVTDIQRVFGEAARVLRPGGYLYFVAPNYGSLWEGHYGIPWIPYLPKAAARLYVRLLRRSDGFLSHLNLLTVGMISSWLDESRAWYVESLGLVEFEQRVREGYVDDLDTARWARPVLRLLGVPLVAKLVVAAAGKLRLWTPLVILARRVA